MANTVKINSTKIVQEVNIVSEPNITKVYIVNQNANAFIGQNNTWREVFLGFYNNESSFQNLFNQELIVSETENVMLIASYLETPESIPVLQRYKFARGKGTWNPIPRVIGQDIIFESSSNVSSGDIITITQGGNTQSYNLGDITGTDIWDFVNANGPYDTTSPQLTYLFIAIEDGVTNLYNFIGANGIYGDGYLTSVEADFVLISTSETVPQVAFNLTVEEFEELPISFVNKLIFNGATVTNNLDGSVTITITGGGATPSLSEVLAVGNYANRSINLDVVGEGAVINFTDGNPDLGGEIQGSLAGGGNNLQYKNTITDLGLTFQLPDSGSSTLKVPETISEETIATREWVEDNAGGGAVDSVNGQTGVVVLDAEDVGLGNVDNTSDLDKPISTATQTALDEKADLTQVGNLIREDFTFGLSQTFTLANNYGQVYSVEVQGQGALSTSQYTLVAPNQVTINDTLNAGDYVVIIYSNAINGVQPYYSQAETDSLVDNVAILKSVGPTYTTNAILTVTQAEYDALTPEPTTLYVIL
jgi:hypothetical protein